MTLQECYEQIGGDYDSVMSRLMMESLVRKFALKFLDDPSYGDLLTAMEAGNLDDAFRAAHTIKGVSMNLGFDRLSRSITELSDTLKSGTFEGTGPMLEQVKEDYAATVDGIRQLDA